MFLRPTSARSWLPPSEGALTEGNEGEADGAVTAALGAGAASLGAGAGALTTLEESAPAAAAARHSTAQPSR